VLHANGIEIDSDYGLALLIALIVFMGIGTTNSLYRSWRLNSILSEIGYVLCYWCLAVLSLASVLYVFPPASILDASVLQFWFLSTPILLIAVRVAIRGTARALRQRGRNIRLVAIVGCTSTAYKLAQSLGRHAWMGLVFVGFFDSRRPGSDRTDSNCSQNYEGDIDTLISQINEGRVHQVYIALPMKAQVRTKELIERFARTPVSVYYAPDLDAFDFLQARWDHIDGQPLVSILETPFLGSTQYLKRAEDLLVSLTVLLVAALPMLFIALLIRISSSGPAIFRQKRYGLDGRSFEIWKFRTMFAESESHAFTQARRNDTRVTRIGQILRRTSLDELPQIFNVIRGDMSIVGPRPHPIPLDNEHLDVIDRFALRYRVKPGITGWAQVNGFRGETDTPEKMESRVRYDIDYIKNWSVMFDLKILFMTMFVTVSGANAY